MHVPIALVLTYLLLLNIHKSLISILKIIILITTVNKDVTVSAGNFCVTPPSTRPFFSISHSHIDDDGSGVAGEGCLASCGYNYSPPRSGLMYAKNKYYSIL